MRARRNAMSSPSSTEQNHASAGGKVILLGEHAVVYGIPALVLGVSRGVTARLLADTCTMHVLRIEGWGVDVATGDCTTTDLGRAFGALVGASGARVGASPRVVEVHVDLPPGGGLGCSAAIGVAVARALDGAASQADVMDRAMAWERIFHGNPSGIDVWAAAHGGIFSFTRGVGATPLAPPCTLHLAIGSTGRASGTKVMVERVRALKQEAPERVNAIFESISGLVQNASHAILCGDVSGLGAHMNANHEHLINLGVSTPELDSVVGLARGAGALGAKLTGAGGGGCVAALAESAEHAEAIVRRWNLAGVDGWTTTSAQAQVEMPPRGAWPVHP